MKLKTFIPFIISVFTIVIVINYIVLYFCRNILCISLLFLLNLIIIFSISKIKIYNDKGVIQKFTDITVSTLIISIIIFCISVIIFIIGIFISGLYVSTLAILLFYISFFIICKI